MGSLFQRLPSGDVIEPGVSPNGKRQSPFTPQRGPSRAVFNGELALNNPIGTIWPNYNQSGALEITVDDDAEPGGCDCIRIIANGDAITLDSAFTWVNVGSDSIGTTAADVNEMIFFAKFLTYTRGVPTSGTILYSVKLNP